MRRNFLKLALTAAAFSVFSCGTDDKKGNDHKEDNNSSAPFTAKVNGEKFTGDNESTTKARSYMDGKQLNIEGHSADGEKHIVLGLLRFDGTAWTTGTYPIKGGYPASISASYEFLPGGLYEGSERWESSYDSSESFGEVTIEEITETRVKGTFHFKAALKTGGSSWDSSNKKEVKEGKFDLKVVKL